MSVLGNARRIISTKATRGENKYMLEEVYFSDIVQEDEAVNNIHQASSTPNPYRAYKDQSGYFHYQFPSLWYTSTCNNKAIGLRRIETKARAKNITLILHIRLQYPSEAQKAYLQPFSFHFLPSDDIDTIMSTMCYKFNEFINSTLSKFAAEKKQYSFSIHYRYDDITNQAMFYGIRNLYDASFNLLNWTNHDVAFTIDNVNNDFCTVFNVRDNLSKYYANIRVSQLGLVLPDGVEDYQTDLFVFSNVWNRRYCFVHANFVSGTSFQYLGRSGDFYPKPSKLYKFNGSTTDFTLAISFNGYQPIRTDEISFIVELAFIYSTGEYLAQ